MDRAFIYIFRRWDRLLGFTIQHVQIVVIANFIAIVLGVLLAVFICGKGRFRAKLANVVLQIAGIIQTIPSLAMYGILLPILVWFGLPGIGFVPAVIGLVLYGQLPIIRNTSVALRGIDDTLVEAARGMGMTDRQILYKVKIPLAVPVIMAGLRTSMVGNIGIATVAVFIGAGGLGRPIFDGIVRSRIDLIIAGALFVSVLALVADGLLAFLEKAVTSKGLRKAANQ